MSKRRINLNRVVLTPRRGQVKICFFGDQHLGAGTYLADVAADVRDYCIKNKIYMIGMGDHIENATRNSVGSGVYSQKMNPQDQVDEIIEFFRPVADAGLLLGVHTGNHCERAMKDSGLDIIKLVCTALGVPYLGYTCFHHFRVGKQSYTAFTTHGATGSATLAGKINAATKTAKSKRVDIVGYAHTHELFHFAIPYEKILKRNKTVVMGDQHVFLTGGYLGYKGSYAEMKGYSPVKVGSPIVTMDSKEFKITPDIKTLEGGVS